MIMIYVIVDNEGPKIDGSFINFDVGITSTACQLVYNCIYYNYMKYAGSHEKKRRVRFFSWAPASW